MAMMAAIASSNIKSIDQTYEQAEKLKQEEILSMMEGITKKRCSMYLEADVKNYINTLLPKLLCDIKYLLEDLQINY